MKQVHQIWVGGELPAREKLWVGSVQTMATVAGWQHRLWTWADLMAAYGSEPMAALFARLMTDFPMPTTYALAADYYRLRVLADKGGMYLDADFLATSWPDVPADADVYLLAEFYKPGMACNGYFCAHQPAPMRMAADLAERHLMARLPLDAPDLPRRYVDMVRRDGHRGGLPHSGIGPGWLRRVVLPAWRGAGVRTAFMAADAVGHRQWAGKSALTHYGAAHWHEGGKGAADPFWQAQAARADDMVARCRQDARQRALDATPAHLRPCGGILPPPRVARAEAAPSVSAPSAGIPPQFRVPRDVRRVVVLSNVTTGFNPDMLPLAAGDLVIHCNHARHTAAAMRVQGTRHWLLVRHGKGRDPRGWHWYHDGGFDGFERVFFVDDATMMRPFRWWREFRAITAKSPTTGFIAANIIRESAPHLPLILGGFEPGVRHGTPQWDGHAWQVEADWYKRHRFTLYRPRKQVRILLLICSCCAYAGRRILAKSAAKVYQQRKACRMTWLRHLIPGNVDVMMVVGRGEPVQEPLVRQLDVADDYWHLPAKMRAAFRDALATADFDWLVKCDDDSFLHLERLVQYVASLPIGSRDIYGAAPSNGRLDCVCGGGGYILHRDMVATIAGDAAMPDEGREDVEVCRAVIRHGGQVVQVPLFNAEATPSPALNNDLISCHHLAPRDMARIRTDCWLM